MARWSYENSLTDIQNRILEQISNHLGMHVLMGNILHMDNEEYDILVSKLKCISQVEECEKYCLSIIAAWVTSCKLGREKSFYTDVIKEIKKRFPQHYHTYVMEIFTSTFYNYQIDTMGVNFSNIKDIRKVILIHGDE